MHTRTLFAIATAMAVGHTNAQESAGKRIFDRVCSECHAPGYGHPGTQRLGWRSDGQTAALEQRKLHPDYVRFVVRHGLAEMPPLRPTELSDEDLAALASYLTATTKQD